MQIKAFHLCALTYINKVCNDEITKNIEVKYYDNFDKMMIELAMPKNNVCQMFCQIINVLKVYNFIKSYVYLSLFTVNFSM